MTYTPITLTSSGGTFDPYAGFGDFYINYQFSTSGAVTLAANVVVSPTVTSGVPISFSILWTAELVLSSFSVSICGILFNQSDVNQTGVFNCTYNGTSWTVIYTPDASEQPQVYYGVASVTAATSGTTTWVAGVDRAYQRVSGAPTTLVGNLIYTAATSGVKDGTQMTVEIAGSITVGSNSLIVFGITISAYDALNGGVAVVATFDATAGVWRSYASNRQNSIQSLSPIAGRSVVGNTTLNTLPPSVIEFYTEGDVLMRTGGAVIAQRISQENCQPGILIGFYTRVNISNAVAKQLFTTPATIALSSSLGSGGINIPYLILLEVVYGSAPFASENTVNIRFAGASSPIYTQVGGLATSSSNIFMFVPVTGTISTSQFVRNVDLELYCPSANPTVGTGSTLKIHCFYNQQILS